MFDAWQIKLQAAEHAFRTGQLDEAAQALRDQAVRESEPGQRLAQEVAFAIIQRADRRVDNKNIAAASRDLQAIVRLIGETDEVHAVRSRMLDECGAAAESLIEQRSYEQVLEQVKQWGALGLNGGRLPALRQMARHLMSARALSHRGQPSDALEQVAAASSLQPELPLLNDLQGQYQQEQKQVSELTTQLQADLTNQHWDSAKAVANQLLSVAPGNALAIEVRRCLQDAPSPISSLTLDSKKTDRLLTLARPLPSGDVGMQFVAWIDAVGGYMVCRQGEVILGQASSQGEADIRLLGDLSRRHAKIRREDGGYVIEPLAAVQLEGEEIDSTTPLSSGDQIDLGGVSLRFTKPHALSASARLECVGRRRFQPKVDAVILMAESCVLGPNWHNHVVCRDWTEDVVLFHQSGKLLCRSMNAIEIDGKTCDGSGVLNPHSHISGDEFALTLEPIA